MKKRRVFTNEFKAKVALEAIRETAPIHEIAHRYEVHPNQVSEWKKLALSNMTMVFENGRNREDEVQREKLKDDRYLKQIGQLNVELDFLKECCRKGAIAIPPSPFYR